MRVILKKMQESEPAINCTKMVNGYEAEMKAHEKLL